MGPALLWSPFFLAAHGIVRLGNALGIPWEADGYSAPYRVLTALGSALYAFIGLELLRRLALRIASPAIALWGVLTAWLASPLVFYMSAHPFMAHAVDFFVNAGFLWMWARQGEPTPSARLAGVGAGIGFLPQMIVWRAVFGAWIVGNPYGIAGAGTFDLRALYVLEVLFSTNRGLFPWTPIAAFALAGLAGPLGRACPAWARLLLAQAGAQLYVVGSWSVWSGAAAFGPRLLTGLFAGFALGLAALYEAGRRRWGMRPVLALSLSAVAWNMILLARYSLEDVPRMGPVPLATLWLGQLTFIGRALGELDRIGQTLLRAPSAGSSRRLSRPGRKTMRGRPV